MPYTIHSHALTSEKPFIRLLTMLMHRNVTFNMIVPGLLKLFRHTPFVGQNTINWWCATYVSVPTNKNGPIKKRMLGPGLEPCSPGRESTTLLMTLESRLFRNAVRLFLVPIKTTFLHYVIIALYSNIIIMSRNRIANNAVFIFSSYS